MLGRPRAFSRLSLLCALLAGCAPTHYVMQYGASNAETGRTWPRRESQEVPRYRYVGELTGEGNFKPEGGAGQGGLAKALRWLAGISQQGPDPVVLQRPQSGFTDANGRIYVTDASRKAVFVFDEIAGKLEVWEFAARNTRFASPVGVVVLANGEVLVSDAELAQVLRLSSTGKPLGSFGAELLKRPTGLAYDKERGLVFVADTQAHDIKLFDTQGRLVDTIGQRGDGDGELNYPTHLAFAKDTLYVTDMMNSRVQLFSADNALKLKFGGRGLYVGNLVRPKGVAADDEGNIYVIESLHDYLLVFDPAGQFLLSIGGTGQGIGQFYLPAGVWVDGNNRVFIADMFNGRVVVLQFLGGG